MLYTLRTDISCMNPQIWYMRFHVGLYLVLYTYIWETNKLFSISWTEHKDETEKEASCGYCMRNTRNNAKTSRTNVLSWIMFKSHHELGTGQVIGRKQSWYKRWVRETIQIRARGNRTETEANIIYQGLLFH